MFKSFITIVATLAVSGFVHAQDAVQWTQAEGGNGHWYERIDDLDTWSAASDYAQSIGAHLISINSSNEDSWAYEQLDGDTCWIGAWQDINDLENYSEPDGGWRWTSSDPWIYTNWNGGGPDNNGLTNEPSEEYGAYCCSGKWNDIYDVDNNGTITLKPSIIEWSADCNGDGIVDYGQILDGTYDDDDGDGILNICEEVMGWGRDDSGQVQVPNDMENVVKVSAGEFHSMALLADGSVRCWGRNNDGQCDVPSNLVDIVDIDAGEYWSLALQADGTLRAWGLNSSGQTNVPSTGIEIIAVTAGDNFGAALNLNGAVVSWGDITEAPTGIGFTQICAGATHLIGIDENGEVHTWGSGSGGSIPADLGICRSVWAGAYFNLAVRLDGTVEAWGQNQSGQCDVPTNLPSIMSVAGADEHAAALSENGDVYRWGNSWDNLDSIPELGSGIQLAAGGKGHILVLQGTIITDCNDNGNSDTQDLADGTSLDCNQNGIPDECDLLNGFSEDCNGNNIPDECESLTDCNSNGVADECEILTDCNSNGIPDVCETLSDCDGDGTSDACEILDGAVDANPADGIPDACQGLPLGACCHNGGCILSTFDDCFSAGGSFAGNGIGCADANCPTTCAGDVNGDNQVGIVDLLTIIDGWGFCP